MGDCASTARIILPHRGKIPHLRGDKYVSGRQSRRITWISIFFHHLRMAKLYEFFLHEALRRCSSEGFFALASGTYIRYTIVNNQKAVMRWIYFLR